MKRISKLMCLLTFFYSLSSLANIYQIADGANQDINKHGVCKNIKNNNCSGTAVMVPTGTSLEWYNFRSNAPTCVEQCSCNMGDTCTTKPTPPGAWACRHFQASWCSNPGQFGYASATSCYSDPTGCPYSDTMACYVVCNGYGTYDCAGSCI